MGTSFTFLPKYDEQETKRIVLIKNKISIYPRRIELLPPYIALWQSPFLISVPEICNGL